MPLIELAHISHWTEQKKYSAVIGVPVHNEERYIARSLKLLDQQADAPDAYGDDYAIVLLLNNCTDGTLAVVRSLEAELKHDVYCVDITLPKNLAHAGMARKLAMDMAARLTAPHGIVLTTDADAVVTTDWVAMTRKHIETGADAVSGFVQHNPAEKTDWPRALKDRTNLECRYEDLLAELYATLDPQPHNPVPCHMVTLGASLAATREAYQKSGGVPPIPCGEDRAFIAALERSGARVRFPRDVIVYTSSRLAGRADGGMAATLKARADCPDLPCDPLLEPVAMACKRAEWRRTLRGLWPTALPLSWAATLKITPAQLRTAWASPSFAQAWQLLETASSELHRSPLTIAALNAEMPRLEALVQRLRTQGAARRSETQTQDATRDTTRETTRDATRRVSRLGQRSAQRLADTAGNYVDRAASVAAKAAATAIGTTLPDPPPATIVGTTQ